MKHSTLAVTFAVVMYIFVSDAMANGNPANPSNVSDNTNALNGQVNGQQSQIAAPTAIAAPTNISSPNQANLAGQGGSLQMNSKSSNFTLFGPQANALRGGDCAGDANGISLYSIFGGIGFSHADESKICRELSVIQMTCSTAGGLVQTGAVLAQNQQLNAVGYKILNMAVDMVTQCSQQMQANDTALELKAAYSKNFSGGTVSNFPVVPPPQQTTNAFAAVSAVTLKNNESTVVAEPSVVVEKDVVVGRAASSHRRFTGTTRHFHKKADCKH